MHSDSCFQFHYHVLTAYHGGKRENCKIITDKLWFIHIHNVETTYEQYMYRVILMKFHKIRWQEELSTDAPSKAIRTEYTHVILYASMLPLCGINFSKLSFSFLTFYAPMINHVVLFRLCVCVWREVISTSQKYHLLIFYAFYWNNLCDRRGVESQLKSSCCFIGPKK